MRIAELQPATLVAHGLPGGEPAASAWLARLLAIYTDTHRRTGEHKEATLQVWRRVSKELLRPPPEHPFQLHQLLFDAVYSEWNVSTLGPRPTWIPTAAEAANTNLARFMRVYVGDEQWRRQRTQQPLRDWPALHAASVRDPESFWAAVFRHEFRLDFAVPPTCMVDRAANLGAGAWLPGARFNVAAAALQGDPDAPAIITSLEASPRQLVVWPLRRLRAQAARVAWALAAEGVTPGATVGLVLPLTADAVAVYLGIVLAGCAAVSIADSFAAEEIERRLRMVGAQLCLTCDASVRAGKTILLYSKVAAAQEGGGGGRVVCLRAATTDPAAPLHLRPRDVCFDDWLAAGVAAAAAAGGSADTFSAVECDAEAVSNILFSSGTTGAPKALPWGHVAPLRCAADAWAHLDVRACDVLAFPTSLGWMMGPWLIYGSRLNRAAMALFDGAPQTRAFGEFVAAAGVTQLGVVPSLVAGWRASGAMDRLHWPALRCFSSTGEASSPPLYHWLSALGGYAPVMECCGGTELAGGFAAGCPLQPQAPSCFSTPAVGTQLVLLGEEAQGDARREQSAHGPNAPPTMGELALRPPLLGASFRLLGGADHHAVYFAGMPFDLEMPGVQLRRHGDAFERLPGGFYVAHGRVDDTMNLGGIKVLP